jgi:uncharacterized phage protein (TIGR02218 family)
MTFDTTELSRASSAPVELFRFSMGGAFWCYALSDKAWTFQGRRYEPATIQREGLQHDGESGSGGLVVRVPKENPVAELFVPGMPTQPVTLAVFRFHRDEATGDTITNVVGFPPGEIVMWAWEGTMVKLSCASVPQMLERRVPSVAVQSQCGWALYGPGCLVARGLFSQSATVTAVDGLEVSVTLSPDRADGWFSSGYLEMPTGQTSFIKSHSSGAVSLLTPLTGLAVGSVVVLVPGCDHSMATCYAKFNNRSRFMGWEDMPLVNPFTHGVV